METTEVIEEGGTLQLKEPAKRRESCISTTASAQSAAYVKKSAQ